MAELYTFGHNGKKIASLDTWTSYIWTERFIKVGDFELNYPYDPDIFDTIDAGTWLRKDGSDNVMRVEKIEIQEPGEEAGYIKFSGRDLTSFLENRISRESAFYNYQGSVIDITARPTTKMHYLVAMACVDLPYTDGSPVNNWENFFSPVAHWEIPGLVIDPPMVDDGIPDVPLPNETVIRSVIPPQYLLDAMYRFANAYNIGFKLYYPIDDILPHFNTWYGVDRTVTQNVVPKLLLTPEAGNIKNVKEIRDKTNFKNVGYGFPNMTTDTAQNPLHAIEFAHDATDSTSGWNRYELQYIAQDEILSVSTDGTVINEILQNRVLSVLNQHPYSTMLDGEMIPIPGFMPGIDFDLGDYLTIKSRSGAQMPAQVVEIISSRDADQGEKKFVTFGNNQS